MCFEFTSARSPKFQPSVSQKSKLLRQIQHLQSMYKTSKNVHNPLCKCIKSDMIYQQSQSVFKTSAAFIIISIWIAIYKFSMFSIKTCITWEQHKQLTLQHQNKWQQWVRNSIAAPFYPFAPYKETHVHSHKHKMAHTNTHCRGSHQI